MYENETLIIVQKNRQNYKIVRVYSTIFSNIEGHICLVHNDKFRILTPSLVLYYVKNHHHTRFDQHKLLEIIMVTYCNNKIIIIGSVKCYYLLFPI